MNAPHQCALMVLLGGMPRSGSTWQDTMVFSGLQRLGRTPDYHAYWDYPKHISHTMNDTAAEQWYAAERLAWSRLKPTSIVVYKTHEFAGAATRFCRRTAVFTTHRCFEGALRSKIGRKWITADDAINASSLVFNVMRDLRQFAQWKRFGALDIEYDAAVAHPEETMSLVLYYLAYHLSLAGDRDVLQVLRQLETPLASDAGDHSRAKPDQTSTAGDLSAGMLQAMAEAKKMMESAGMLDHLGVRWCGVDVLRGGKPQ